MLQLSLDDIRAGIERAASGDHLPAVEQWDPPLSGDIDIRIARDGTWYHEGTPFERLALVRLFASLLKYEGGDYFLVTPAEKWRIQVEAVPFVLIALDVRLDGQGLRQLVFTTNLGDPVCADAGHPLRIEIDPQTGQPTPYLRVRRNLDGLLSRPVYYQLVELVELVELAEPAAAGERHGVTSAGVFFPLG